MLIHRRQLLAGLGAASLLPLPARAEIACQMVNGRQVCQAGLSFSPDMRTAQQECPYWCWAACIEAAFAVRGHRVAQSDIVARLFGDLVCAPADGLQITQALSGNWQGTEGGSFSAAAEVLIDANFGLWRDDSALVAAEELRADRPLILGTMGHAVLVTAMTYATSTWRTPEVLEVIVRDPWPTSPNRRVLSAEELAQINFLATVSVG